MNNAIQYPGAPGERLPEQPASQPQRQKEKILYDERGLIDLRTHVGRIQITVRRPEEKVDLEASEILRRLCGSLQGN